MPELFDYLCWRGDLDMNAVPFNDVDFAILCRMAYAPFGAIVSPAFEPQVTVSDAAAVLLEAAARSREERFFRMDEDAELLTLMAQSARFGGVRLGGFTDVYSASREEQFSAVTAFLPDSTVAVAFRGTDGTLVGWKEDFELASSDAVPAQLDAVRYVNGLASSVKRLPLRLGGHSKGGNLAVYAAARSSARVQKRILSVRNFDGPGFLPAMLASSGYLAVESRIHTVLPTSSVVGMLLEHDEDFSVIDSKSMGIFQHNMYCWQVLGGSFVLVDERTNSSRFVDATLKEWLANMPRDKREKLVDSIFDIVGASDAKTLRQLWERRSLTAVIKAARCTDEETRELLSEGLRLLRSAAKSSLPLLVDGMRDGRERRAPEAG